MLPMDYHDWRKEWNEWKAANANYLKDVRRSPFQGKNFLADQILGVWSVNGRIVELSEVVFPNFVERDANGHLMHYDVRRIGLTFEDDTAVVDSFSELEEVLGLTA
jgi:hypothetical protein